jgi:hypothetical protein
MRWRIPGQLAREPSSQPKKWTPKRWERQEQRARREAIEGEPAEAPATVSPPQAAGFNDRGWLDAMGHPQSEDLRIRERFHRRDFGHMDLELTSTIPKRTPSRSP